MLSPKIMVMGVGNVLFSDEGLGVRFLDELAKLPLPENVELLEGGTAGLELVHLIQEVDFLIIVDSINAQDEPGALFRFLPEDMNGLNKPFKTSFHQIGLLEMLTMAKIMGPVPKTIIFGMQPRSLDWSLDVTPEIRAKFPRLTELVCQEIDSILQKGAFVSYEAPLQNP